MTYYLYIICGLVPSLVWLLFYLRKDKNPEPAKMILKIFLFGFAIALPAVMIETGILDLTKSLNLPSLALSIINTFLAVALIEEFLKYLVVREKALKTFHFDEPTDAMIYMITSAMGFAAAENVLIFFSLGPNFLLTDVLSLGILRLLGATFLHALCSGMLGYFLAVSFFKTKRKYLISFFGLFIVTLLHGLYNFSIIELSTPWNVIIPIIILVGSAVFIAESFKRLKKLKSISRI